MAQNSSSNSSSNTSINTSVEKKRSLSPEIKEEVRVLGIAEYEGAALCMLFPASIIPSSYSFPPLLDLRKEDANLDWEIGLAEAFAVDEVARYFVDTQDMEIYSEEYKWKLHLDILRYITAAHCYKGIVTTIGPNYDAVALWYAFLSLTVWIDPFLRHIT